MFSKSQILTRAWEQYADMMPRIFPESFEEMPDGTKRSVMSITFQVTDGCNLQCSYCYQIHKGHNVMPISVAKQAIDDLLDGKMNYCNPDKNPAICLEFIGGEPFLAIDTIEEIYEYFLKRTIEMRHHWAINHYMSITSNGVLYFDERVQNFLNKYKYKIGLSITLDGNKELHDSCRRFPDGSPSYEYAVAAIKDWTSKGLYMGSKITIAPGNVEFLSSAVKHMVELNYADIHANCVFEKGWEPEHEIILYNQLKDLADYFIENKLYTDVYFRMFDHAGFQPLTENDNNNWCGGDGRMLAISPDGYYYPCLRFMETSLGDCQEPFIIGEVGRDIGEEQEWKDRVNCLYGITRESQSTQECYNCPVARGCSWCTAYNYQENGTPDSRCTYICGMHKAASLANVYYWNKLFQSLGVDFYFEMYLPKGECLKIIDEKEYELLYSLSQTNKENKICVNVPEDNDSNKYPGGGPIGC